MRANRKKQKISNPNAYVFEVKKGANVLSLKASEVKVNTMPAETIELLIEGDSFQELLYLLVP